MNEEQKNMTFGEALKAMCDGKAVRLPHWFEEVCVKLQKPDEHSKMTASYLYIESRSGCVPWNPTQVELLSNSWEIFNR